MDKWNKLPQVVTAPSQGWCLVCCFEELLPQCWTNSSSWVKYLQEHWHILFSHGVGTQSSTCTLSEYDTASGVVRPQHKPSSQFIILLGPFCGVPSGDSFSSSSSWWDLNLWNWVPQSTVFITRPHSHHTYKYTQTCTRVIFTYMYSEKRNQVNTSKDSLSTLFRYCDTIYTGDYHSHGGLSLIGSIWQTKAVRPSMPMHKLPRDGWSTSHAIWCYTLQASSSLTHTCNCNSICNCNSK